MTFLGLTLLFAGLTAAADSCPVSIVAVQATNEGRENRSFDQNAKSVEGALKSLDYDTFRTIKSINKSIPFEDETKVQIDDHYTLYVTPVSKDSDGRVRLKTRITMKHPRDKEKNPITALDTTLTMSPGQHLNLGGLKLERGELIVVLSIPG